MTSGRTALLIIDMLNSFEFDDYEKMLEAGRRIVKPINDLRARAHAADMPVIYINDNYGRWLDERSQLIAHLTHNNSRGHELACTVAPIEAEYFIVKPEASGFYATSLPALLPRLKVSSLVLTGIAADICVQFTAADAHMREYKLWVPRDAVAGSTPERVEWALEIMSNSMDADIRASSEREFLP
jgi:nicotinamidase-related amidase